MENPAFVLESDGISSDEKSNNRKAAEKEQDKVYSFEEAVTLTGSGKYHYFLLIVCGLCFMTVMVETMGVSVIMPFMKCDIASTIAEQGFLASSGFLGIVLSSHIMGFLADTWGRVKTLRAALACSLIATIISAFSVNIWMLIVFRFLNGFFISGGQACVFSFLGEFHGRNTRVKYVTLLSMFLPIGVMYFPAVALGILPLQIDTIFLGLKFSSWRVLLLVNSGLNLLALCGLLLSPESPKYDLIQGRHEKAMKTLRLLFKQNTDRPEGEYPVKHVYIDITGACLSSIHGFKDAFNLVWSQTVPLFYRKRVWHTINICVLMFVIYFISQGIFMWFPTMLDQLVETQDQGYLLCESMYMIGDVSRNSTTTIVDNCGANVNTKLFEVLIMIGASFTIIYLVFAFTIDIVGKKFLLLGWLFIAAGCCIALHWVSSFVFSVLLLTITAGIGNCGGLVSTIAIEFYPTNVSAMAMCLIMMIGRLGAAVGSNVFGVALINYCDSLFYVCMVVIASVATLGFLLPDKGGKKKKEIIEATTSIDSNLSKGNKQQSEA